MPERFPVKGKENIFGQIIILLYNCIKYHLQNVFCPLAFYQIELGELYNKMDCLKYLKINLMFLNLFLKKTFKGFK